MKRNMLFVALFCAGTVLLSCKQSNESEGTSFPANPYVSEVWVADNADGTYTNPILYADYSDPDVVRVGNDFYMTASSFNMSPGLPILHSKDLVNWQIVNHALPIQIPTETYDVPQPGKGVWAPSIRYHKRVFYIYWGDPDFGVYMVKTKNPLGSWSEPVHVLKGRGIIDPCPLWDDDGKAYLVVAWAGSRAGVNSILTMYEMDSDGKRILDRGRNVYSGHDHNHTVEGPKLLKRNGYYYIFAPAGGVTHGWQLLMRSKNIYGPYEDKMVMAQGATNINGPHQGGYVETQSGEPWFVHFQDRDAYGRILHLNPVNWVDDWPIIGIDKEEKGWGEPVLSYRKPNVGKTWPIRTPTESDEFNGGKLGYQWSWAANEQVTWSIMMPQGFLRLTAVPKKVVGAPLWTVSNLLLQRFPAPGFTATTKVKFSIEWEVWQGKQAGLIVMGNDYAYLAIKKDADGYYLEQIINKSAHQGGQEKSVANARLANNEVYLQVKVESPDALCAFSYSDDGKSFTFIGEPFQAKQVLWSGAKLGIFCVGEPNTRNGGYADFEWFRMGK